jgi:lipopolysaccharide biosynthesis regulator YciM
VIKGYIALAQAKSGQRDEAVKRLDELKQESTRRYVPGVAFAFAYIALGQKDEAFVWLEKDVADHTGLASSYAVEPALDDVRADPRFKAMLKRICRNEFAKR